MDALRHTISFHNTSPRGSFMFAVTGVKRLHKWNKQGSVLVLAVGFIVAILLHYVAAYHFPTPWPDEATFLIPAIHFSENMSLVAPELNAPQGIFWMPDGYYVFMGTVFRVLPTSLATARLVSLVLVFTFVCSLYVVARHLGVPSLVVVIALAVWLMTPRVVLMSNVARMEALVLAIIGIALMLVAHQRWGAGLAFASLSALVHPVGLLLFLCFVSVAVVFWRSIHFVKGTGRIFPGRLTMWYVIGAVVLAWILETLRFALNFDIASIHIAYQFARKANRSLGIGVYDLILFGIVSVGILICYLQRERERERERRATTALLFTLAGGLDVVQVFGQEMWYEVYRSEVAGLLVVIGMLVLIRDAMTISNLGIGKAVTIGVGIVIGLTAALGLIYLMSNRSQIRHFSAFGMSIWGGDRDEWPEFVERVQAELGSLDVQLDRPALVLIDRSSAMSLILRSRPWSHLRFVQWTGATPLDENTSVDYLLFSLHKPDWRKDHTQARFPSGGEFARIVSRNETFELVLFEAE